MFVTSSSASAKYIGPVFRNVAFIITQDFCGGTINNDDEEKQVSLDRKPGRKERVKSMWYFFQGMLMIAMLCCYTRMYSCGSYQFSLVLPCPLLLLD
jgi:hypothetical protein